MKIPPGRDIEDVPLRTARVVADAQWTPVDSDQRLAIRIRQELIDARQCGQGLGRYPLEDELRALDHVLDGIRRPEARRTEKNQSIDLGGARHGDRRIVAIQRILRAELEQIARD